MFRRNGLTLMEVLLAILVTGIGLLALMVLFPLGAINMAQSLKDDRCAQAAAQASAVASALNLRNDSSVSALLTDGKPVYMDPVGLKCIGLPATVAGTNLPRTTASAFNIPTGMTASRYLLKWCSLGDDLGFDGNGAATSNDGFLDRSGLYTWAYLLRRRYPNVLVEGGTSLVTAPSQVEMDVVVYLRRNLQLHEGETAYTAEHSPGSSKVLLDYSGQERPAVKRGGWVLDASTSTTAELPRAGRLHAFFFRVVGVEDVGGDQLQLEVQPKPDFVITKVVVLENVAEVFPRQGGWRP
jgi:hypothetical protein